MVTAASATELTACPFCGAKKTRHIFEQRRSGDVWHLAVCDSCQLHFTSPIPTLSQIGSFYSGTYHNNLLQSGAGEQVFGKKYQRYADWIRHFVPQGKTLDIGCSTGLLVRMLKDRGFEARGIELNTATAEWGARHYGVSIDTEPLQPGTFPPNSFDVVSMTDVLEHMPDPREFLKCVHSILSPRGHVLVTFPDIRSFESQYWRFLSLATGRKWLWWTCHIPLHTWEFTRPTAERMFQSAGFEVVGFRRSQPRPDVDSSLMKLLALPTQVLRLPGVSTLAGTQMEFMLRRVESTAGSP